MKINADTTAFKANKMTYPQAKLLNSALLDSKHVDIICHDSTDDDSANSALLMWEYLNQKGIESRIILSGDVNKIHIRNKDANIEEAESLDKNQPADTVLCVDFSSIGRMQKNTIGLLQNASKVLCIDHHGQQDLFGDDCIEITKNLDITELPEDTSLHYIDTSAKSATSVIYRFFEALNQDISRNQAFDIMSGFISDGVKKGIIECDGKSGQILLSEKFINDDNASEIFAKLVQKLSPDDMQQIAKNVDIMSNLTPDEIKFYNSLNDKVKFTDDKKVAYIEIPQDDKTWESLGGDNPETSTILNRFRKNILRNMGNSGLKYAVVFYPSKDMYRLSIHSNTNNLNDFYNNAITRFRYRFNDFSIGGHRSRGGGKIVPYDKDDCQRFSRDIIDCILDTDKESHSSFSA